MHNLILWAQVGAYFNFVDANGVFHSKSRGFFASALLVIQSFQSVYVVTEHIKLRRTHSAYVVQYFMNCRRSAAQSSGTKST